MGTFETLIDNDYCFGCGSANPIGLHLTFGYLDNNYFTEWTPLQEHQGWSDRIHGGLIALLMDEVLSRVALNQLGREWVTAELTTRLVRPARIGIKLIATARIKSVGHGLVQCVGEVRESNKGELIARGSAKLMRAHHAFKPKGNNRMLGAEPNFGNIEETPLERAVPIENYSEDSSDTNIGDPNMPVISIFSAQSESEAQIVRGILESEGIPVFVRDISGASSSIGSFSVAETRWADLLVARSHEAAALKLLASYQSSMNDTSSVDGSTNRGQ